MSLETSTDQANSQFIHAIPSYQTESSRARSAALRLLTTRPRSVSEMRERLGRRFNKSAVEEIVTRLLTEGLLDDEDYARQWRQNRERRKPRSRGMIAGELKARGIADDLIVNALEGYDSTDAARRAAYRYASRQSGTPRATFDRRVGAFLARRGFESSIVGKVLQELREELGIES